MPRDSITRSGMPRSSAISSPAAFARLLMTIAISASSLRRAIALAIASKLEPRPEMRMPRRILSWRQRLAVLHTPFTAALRADFADNPGLALVGASQEPERPVGFLRRHHEDHP